MIRGIETSLVFKDNQVNTMVPGNDNWAFGMEENLVEGRKRKYHVSVELRFQKIFSS
jgi:hypothetical protein